MRNILITSFDMSIGGVERSLINMLNSFDYDNFNVDLKLCRNEGELFNLINPKVNILPETKEWKTFGTPLLNVIKNGEYGLASARMIAKLKGLYIKRFKRIKEIGYYQSQLANHLSNKYIENIDREYDIAISYVWPHDRVAYKVKAKKKIAWIHTDYSTIFVNRKLDLKVWSMFDYIVSISKDCTETFKKIYPSLKDKIIQIENIRSYNFIKTMAEQDIDDFTMDKDYIKLLTVGRLCHQKGIDNAIKAMKIIKYKGINNIKWYVIGYGPDQDKLQNLIKLNNLDDYFIMLGKRTNPYPYMKKCDIYIQPSRYEGKAVTIIEAQILGKPVLITNYPTASSQLKHNIDGYITDQSIEGIVDGVEKLIYDCELRKKLEKNTKEFDYSNFEELEKLYEIMRV